MKKQVKVYRPKVKEALCKQLRSLGYREHEHCFEKFVDRVTMRYTLYDKHFELFVREPREGWWLERFPYTYANIPRFSK